MYFVLFLDIRLGLCKVKIKRHIMQETNYKVNQVKIFLNKKRFN